MALTDDKLRELLDLVDLGYLFEQRSDANVNWEQSLSLGETQRLAMARLFYHQPMFAILDECTSGVSQMMERRLYDLCQARNITCITISHRPALIAYHDLKLELDGRGSYSLETISHSGAGSSRALTPSASSAALTATDPVKASTEDSHVSAADVTSHVLSEGQLASFPALTSPVETAKRQRLPRFARFLKLLRLLVPSISDRAARLLFGLVSDRCVSGSSVMV